MSAEAEPTRSEPRPGVPRLPRIDPRYVPLAVTISLFVAMAGAGSVLYDSFFAPQRISGRVVRIGLRDWQPAHHPLALRGGRVLSIWTCRIFDPL